MKNTFKGLEAFDNEDWVNVIIETPKGSRIKYAYHPPTELFEVRKALPEGMVFPFNFGFIPATVAEDGDPLDILILNEDPLVPGCLLHARLAGALKAEQKQDGKKVRNDRLIGLAMNKETGTALASIRLNDALLKEIQDFFETYNELLGKKFKVLGTAGSKQAMKIVRRAVKARCDQ